MNAYTLRIIVDHWMPRLAAGFTGAMAGLAIHAAFEARWGYVLAWSFAAFMAVNWWACTRRIREDRRSLESLETDVWMLRNAVRDVNVLAKTTDPADIRAVEVLFEDMEHLFAPALRRAEKGGRSDA